MDARTTTRTAYASASTRTWRARCPSSTASPKRARCSACWRRPAWRRCIAWCTKCSPRTSGEGASGKADCEMGKGESGVASLLRALLVVVTLRFHLRRVAVSFVSRRCIPRQCQTTPHSDCTQTTVNQQGQPTVSLQNSTSVSASQSKRTINHSSARWADNGSRGTHSSSALCRTLLRHAVTANPYSTHDTQTVLLRAH